VGCGVDSGFEVEIESPLLIGIFIQAAVKDWAELLIERARTGWVEPTGDGGQSHGLSVRLAKGVFVGTSNPAPACLALLVAACASLLLSRRRPAR